MPEKLFNYTSNYVTIGILSYKQNVARLLKNPIYLRTICKVWNKCEFNYSLCVKLLLESKIFVLHKENMQKILSEFRVTSFTGHPSMKLHIKHHFSLIFIIFFVFLYIIATCKTQTHIKSAFMHSNMQNIILQL